MPALKTKSFRFSKLVLCNIFPNRFYSYRRNCCVEANITKMVKMRVKMRANIRYLSKTMEDIEKRKFVCIMVIVSEVHL